MTTKKWKIKRNTFRRKIGSRGPRKKRLLIVCEGEKTEPNYFLRFRVSSAVIRVYGLGKNTVSLVNHAIELSNRAKANDERFDKIWCVFDRDSFPPENFNKAIELCKKKGLNAAYSNEAFEIWYLLHFCYNDAAIGRDTYGERLTAKLGYKYKKNSEEMYGDLEKYQEDAIKRAKKLLDSYGKPNPLKDNPSTTVHLLVEELNKYR